MISNYPAVKERPILFSAPMVLAILDGSKTMTRRAIKSQPFARPEYNDDTGLFEVYAGDELSGTMHCPYGQPGDRIYVRETWQASRLFDLCPPRDIPPGSEINYAADESGWNHCAKTRVSIHMPRWASRITLEVVSVRVERLQDISEVDALAEGVECVGKTRLVGELLYKNCQFENSPHLSPISSFSSLWKSINGPESWAANPWVWVIEFRRLAP